MVFASGYAPALLANLGLLRFDVAILPLELLSKLLVEYPFRAQSTICTQDDGPTFLVKEQSRPTDRIGQNNLTGLLSEVNNGVGVLIDELRQRLGRWILPRRPEEERQRPQAIDFDLQSRKMSFEALAGFGHSHCVALPSHDEAQSQTRQQQDYRGSEQTCSHSLTARPGCLRLDGYRFIERFIHGLAFPDVRHSGRTREPQTGSPRGAAQVHR